MSREHRHLIRQEKTDKDRQQTRFTTTGTIDKRKAILASKKNIKAKANDIVYCPFCLWRGKLLRFAVSTKTGFSTSLAECPDCGQRMLMRTITMLTKMTNDKIRAYAKWCFMYAQSGFWNKVTKGMWDMRLKQYKWDVIFWITYRRLKGETRPTTKKERDSGYKINPYI